MSEKMTAEKTTAKGDETTAVKKAAAAKKAPSTTDAIMSTFVNKDGSWTNATWILLLAVPAYLAGYIRTGHGMIVAAFVVSSVDGSLSARDKYQIRYNVMTPPDLYKEMKEACDKAAVLNIDDTDTDDMEIMLECALEALAKKFGEFLHLSRLSNRDPKNDPVELIDNMALLCQDAAYTCMNQVAKIATAKAKNADKNVDKDTAIASEFPSLLLASCMSILALIAKNDKIRKQYLQSESKQKNYTDKDDRQYSLKLPIELIRLSLDIAKSQTDKSQEQASAKVQRQACLWLGALADECASDAVIGSSSNDKSHSKNTSEPDTLARLVAKSDGVQVIVDALSWYRCHVEVVNWGLWALFQLCYEHDTNAALLVNTSSMYEHETTFAVPIIVAAMKNCVESVDAIRHGTALLFDLLRQKPSSGGKKKPKYDSDKVRDAALAAGLHDMLSQVLERHGSIKDISVMAAEMLAGTGYQATTAAVVIDKKSEEKKAAAVSSLVSDID